MTVEANRSFRHRIAPRGIHDVHTPLGRRQDVQGKPVTEPLSERRLRN